MEKGDLKQNGVHLLEHEWNTFYANPNTNLSPTTEYKLVQEHLLRNMMTKNT